MKTVIVDPRDIERLGRLQCTVREAASFLDIRSSQFRALLAKDDEARRAWERGRDLGRISIRRKQLRLGDTNATMAIFLGKQYLGQRDVQSHEAVGDSPLELDASQLTQEERNALRKLLARQAESGEGAG